MKYLCLAYEEEHTLNALTEREWHALRDETLAYVQDLRKRGRLIVTEALQSVHTATTVRVRGGRLSTTDGPFAE
ncbi:MAG: YciI family protein, partial [Candidatus Rokuibacteriota bacterium]